MAVSIQLYLGDCLDVLKTIPAGSVDAVITDPPYGVFLNGKRTKRERSLENTGYNNLDDSPELIKSVVVQAINLCRGVAPVVIATPGARNLHAYPTPDDIGCAFSPSGAGLGRWGFVCMHPILYYGKDPYVARGLGGRPNSFEAIAAGEIIDGFPVPKPLYWMRWLVARASFPNQTILDPFMGSGTTGVACAQLGRNFIGIEIEPKYFEIARRRIEEAQKQPPLFVDVEEPIPEQAELLR